MGRKESNQTKQNWPYFFAFFYRFVILWRCEGLIAASCTAKFTAHHESQKPLNIKTSLFKEANLFHMGQIKNLILHLIYKCHLKRYDW